MATSMEEQVKETLECKICFTILKNPKTLPCRHTYCFKCLDQMVRKNGEESSVKCPECRKVHILPDGGLHAYKVSYTMNTLVDIFQSMDVGTQPNCTICKERNIQDVDARSKCLQCDKNMCENCEDFHSKFFQGHTLLYLGGDKTCDIQSALEMIKERTVYCKTHKNNPVEIYCEIDQCTVCPTCYVIAHSGHKCMDIHQAAQNNIKHIDDLVKSGDKLLESFETVTNDTTKYKETMEKEASDITNELTNDMNIAIQAIRENYKANIDKVTERKEICSKQIEAHLGHVQLQRTITETMLQHLNAVKQHGHDAELANMTKEINEKSEEWTRYPACDFESRIKFSLKRGKVLNNKITLGNVDVKNVQRKEPQPLKLIEPWPVLINHRSLTDMAYLMDLNTTANTQIVACNYQRSVKIYDENLTMVTEINGPFTNITSISDVILLTSGTDEVHFYNTDGTKNRDLKVEGLTMLRGLAVNSKNELTVCDIGTNTLSNVDMETGQILKQSKVGLLQSPHWVAINSKDVVLVSDLKLHCIIAMTSDFKELFRYGTLGSGQNQLSQPTGLTTDSADNIIIADWDNNRVHLLNPQGKFIKYLRTASDGLVHPRAVTINKQGHLLVGEGTGKVYTIQYTEE